MYVLILVPFLSKNKKKRFFFKIILLTSKSFSSLYEFKQIAVDFLFRTHRTIINKMKFNDFLKR